MTQEERVEIQRVCRDLDYLRTDMLPNAAGYVRSHITEIRVRLEVLLRKDESVNPHTGEDLGDTEGDGCPDDVSETEAPR